MPDQKCYENEIKIRRTYNSSMALRFRSFSEKNIEKKHLCCHENNYYYFWKLNVPAVNLTVDSRNMISVSENMCL